MVNQGMSNVSFQVSIVLKMWMSVFRTHMFAKMAEHAIMCVVPTCVPVCWVGLEKTARKMLMTAYHSHATMEELAMTWLAITTANVHWVKQVS